MRPTLLVDGDCGLCRASGDWLARRVSPSELRVMELQQVPEDETLLRAVGERDLTAALHLVRADGTVASGAAAVLGAGRHVPVLGALAALYDHPAGHALWEPAYRLVARNRHRIGRMLGIPAVCATIRPQRPTDQSVGR
jgi:predicted DCC family thiol-disulfide oxidoreductase YuxK